MSSFSRVHASSRVNEAAKSRRVSCVIWSSAQTGPNSPAAILRLPGCARYVASLLLTVLKFSCAVTESKTHGVVELSRSRVQTN